MAQSPDNSNQQNNFNNKEAAEFLRVSTVTLYRERTKGKLNFRRVGAGKLVYTREDLESYLEQQKRAAYNQNKQVNESL